MYNAARKEEYLSTISNDNSKKFMYRIFLAAAEFEYMSDKDLCNFNNGEALYFVEEATSTGDCSSYISLIKTYSNWCIEKGFCYRNGWREFKSSEVDKRKKYHTSYIRNMDEFEEMLSVVFIRDADFNETTETAKELIIRLCFLGMENNEIMHLKKNMIDFENAVIYSPIYSDSIYEVSDKILKLCKYCIAQSEERYNIKNGKTRTERLCENEYVFRQRIGTLKKNDENRPINDTLVIRRIQEFNKKYSEKTGIVKKITAEKLRKSGLFCEIQKAEDKNDYIYNEIKKQIYKKHPDITHRQLYERVKTIKEEYSIWVKSFEYTGFEFSPLYAYAKTTDIFEKITLLWKEEKKGLNVIQVRLCEI